MSSLQALLVGCGLCLAAGCGSSHPVPESAPRTASAATQPGPGSSRDVSSSPVSAVEEPLPSITLGGPGGPSGSQLGSRPAEGSADPRAEAIAALQPLQTLLGQWRGTTLKEVGDFKGVDAPAWVWDLKTDRNRPALVMSSKPGLYFREARLTWDPNRGSFQLDGTTADGTSRSFQGRFTEAPEQFQEAGTTVHRRFKLQFDEVGREKDRWQLVFNQQNNDRYLLELSRARANDFFRFDTVGHQREGTSFALSDSDYGERKCIISGGLGTIQVAYQGKSYWVCCTGCQAAFQEDPEGWLKEAAKMESRQ